MSPRDGSTHPARPGPELVAHIDGGARGNPGPAGYGVHIEYGAGGSPTEIYGFIGRATNNVAEYAALLALLERAMSERASSLRILSDSELLVRQRTGTYRVQEPGVRVLLGAARRLAVNLRLVSYEHVPRDQNREADALATRAMDLEESNGPLPAALGDLPRPPAPGR